MTAYAHNNERRERVRLKGKLIDLDSTAATDDPTSEAYHLRHNFLTRKPESAVVVPIREKTGRGLGLDGPVPIR